jgi:hypothetical protein
MIYINDFMFHSERTYIEKFVIAKEDTRILLLLGNLINFKSNFNLFTCYSSLQRSITKYVRRNRENTNKQTDTPPEDVSNQHTSLRKQQFNLCITSTIKQWNVFINRFDQRVARQQLCKHGSTPNKRWGCVFYVVRAEQRWNNGVMQPACSNLVPPH